MNILHINSYFEEDFYQEIYTRLNQSGFKNTIIIPCKYGDKRYNNRKATCHVIESYDSLDKLFLKHKIKKILKAIGKQKLDFSNIDIVHSYSLYSNGTIAYEISKKIHKPYIITIRSSDLFLSKIYFLYKKYIKKILKNASKIIFISKSCKDSFAKLNIIDNKELTKSSVVIPNGMSNIFFNNAKPKILDKKESLNFLFVGRNDKNKNNIYVANELKKYQRKFTFTIVGSNPNQNIENKISKYSFIIRKPPITLEKTLDYYKQADIFIMCSLQETFGIAYIEAISQGVPIIYSQNTGIDGEFNEGEIGYHVNTENKGELINKIELILSQYNQISKNCIDKSKRFSWDEIIKKYLIIYDEIKKNINN